MAGAITDLIDRVTDSTTGRPVIGALAAPGKAIAAASVNLADATNWTTTTAIHFSIYKTMVVGGVTVKDPTTQTDWKGTLAGTVISSLTITGGTDRAYVAGDIVEITPTARYAKDLYDLLITLFNQDGSLKPAPIQTALNLGAGSLNGWNALGFAPNTVTPLGNRSYQLVFNSTDLSSVLSAGYRLRTTRTVAAPNQCTSLNGTTQYYSKAAPAGTTFTDDFVVSAWIKLTSYAAATIISRYNGTSGFDFGINASGQLVLFGYNAGAANFSGITSYQSVPLNRWVHVTAQLDMSAFTATTTTSYVMIDGLDTPATVTRGGTNPTALVQAGNLEIGSRNAGTLFFPGKIAQAALFSAKVTQATMLTYISQGLAGTETSLVSAYSFNNSINDLNTTSANNLTANGAAVATSADSPFGNQVDGTISTTLDYAIVQKVAFSTNTTVTVQVPEGCTIPSSGGVTSVVYSNQKAPYLFPTQVGKWQVMAMYMVDETINFGGLNTWTVSAGCKLVVPIGEWNMHCQGSIEFASTVAGVRSGWLAFKDAAPTNSLTNQTYLTRVATSSANSTYCQVSASVHFPASYSAQATYQLYGLIDTSSGGETWRVRASQGAVVLTAEPAYL
jgi:hypothetical protein